MFCKECGTENKTGGFCKNCGQPLEKKLEKSILEKKEPQKEQKEIVDSENKKRGLLIICVVAIVFVVLGIALSIFGQKNDEGMQDVEVTNTETTVQEEITEKVSEEIIEVEGSSIASDSDNIGVMNIDYDMYNYEFTDEQKQAIFYNAKSSLEYEMEYFERNPDVFIGTSVEVGTVFVEKILTETDTEIEYIVEYGANYVGEETYYMYIKSEVLSSRILEGDILQLTGTFMGIEAVQINGVSSYLPCIQADINKTRIYETDYWSVDEMETIAQAILGEEIKVQLGEFGYQGYIGTFMNLSNADLQEISMSDYISEPYQVSNLYVYNSMGEGRPILPSADFEYFYYFEYVSDYNGVFESLSEITYYDKDFNAVWKREFNEGTLAFYNYTMDNLYVSVGNKLYVIDNETGEDVVDPISIGITGEIYVIEDDVYVISSSEQGVLIDALVEVNLETGVTWRQNLTESRYSVEIVNVTEELIYLAVYIDYNELLSVNLYNRDTGELQQTIDKFY